MDLHLAAQICGGIGDALNLVGTWILAGDLFERVAEHSDAQKSEEFARALERLGVTAPVSVGDVPARSKDIALDLAVQAVLRGRRGFRLMVCGFAFLVLYRVLEIANSVFSEFQKFHLTE